MKHLLLAALSAIAALSACGCVRPGRVDPTVLRRYQEGLVKRGAARRAGDKPLGLLQPTGQEHLPGLRLSKVEDADGKTVTRIELSLDEAVLRALANNLDIRVVSFDPAIAREEVLKAAAAFDATLFASITFGKEDKGQGGALAAFVPEQTRKRTYQVGLRKRTTSGAEVSLTYDMDHEWTNSALDKEYEQALTATLTQPLLRDAWRAVNLATLRVARIDRRISDAAFRAKVEETIAGVIKAYWALQQARRAVQIQEWLLVKTKNTEHMVKEREKLDATLVHTKQAEAARLRRWAQLVRARKLVTDAQDQLGRILGDKQINVLNDYQIAPTTDLSDSALVLDAADQLATALARSPLLEQARLAIRSAGITVQVAQNQILPRLDLAASLTLQGLAGTPAASNEEFYRGDHLGYSVSLAFEYPLGNRQRKADLRRARLEKLKAITTLQDLADQVAVVVRERVRLVRASYTELAAQRAAVAATRAQLEAMDLTEKRIGELTPEYLSLKLSTQELLATAQLAALQAVVDYNNALADLRQVTGTLLELPRLKIALPAAIGTRPPTQVDK